MSYCICPGARSILEHSMTRGKGDSQNYSFFFCLVKPCLVSAFPILLFLGKNQRKKLQMGLSGGFFFLVFLLRLLDFGRQKAPGGLKKMMPIHGRFNPAPFRCRAGRGTCCREYHDADSMEMIHPIIRAHQECCAQFNRGRCPRAHGDGQRDRDLWVLSKDYQYGVEQ